MYDLLFSGGSMAAMVSWGLLIFLPRWRGVAQVVASIAVPTLLSVAYSALIGVWWSRSQGGFGSLDDVHALFQTRGRSSRAGSITWRSTSSSVPRSHVNRAAKASRTPWWSRS